MNGDAAPQGQTRLRVELEDLPGGMAAMAMERDGELLLLLDHQPTPERLRDDLASVLGHFIDSGLVGWNGGPQEPGLP